MSRDELDRLLFGPEPGQKPAGMGTVRFVVYCPGNSDVVLERCKGVLESALRLSSEGEFREDVWASSLPSWFVARCPKELSQQALEERLRLPLEERLRLEREERWPLQAFVYWFKPDERWWWWWDAAIVDPNTIYVAVEVKDWPFPWESLRQLLLLCGATSVEAEE